LLQTKQLGKIKVLKMERYKIKEIKHNNRDQSEVTKLLPKCNPIQPNQIQTIKFEA